ncbi:hypothetical protein DM77_2741 [Burkholderia mallei]|nr:hypothetical protein DM77_2741 [Burkholderia mallei]
MGFGGRIGRNMHGGQVSRGWMSRSAHSMLRSDGTGCQAPPPYFERAISCLRCNDQAD